MRSWTFVPFALVAVLLSWATAPSHAADAEPQEIEVSEPVSAPPLAESSWNDRFFFGGGIGASFGDVDYLEIAPLVGFQVHPRVSTGIGVFWRQRSDDRYTPSIDTTDYGGNVFARFHIANPVFAQVEYEYVDYEIPTGDGTVRDSASSFLVGAGVFQPIGGRAGFFASALYNVTYDENDEFRPYDSPWVYRAGVSVGF